MTMVAIGASSRKIAGCNRWFPAGRPGRLFQFLAERGNFDYELADHQNMFLNRLTIVPKRPSKPSHKWSIQLHFRNIARANCTFFAAAFAQQSKTHYKNSSFASAPILDKVEFDTVANFAQYPDTHVMYQVAQLQRC